MFYSNRGRILTIHLDLTHLIHITAANTACKKWLSFGLDRSTVRRRLDVYINDSRPCLLVRSALSSSEVTPLYIFVLHDVDPLLQSGRTDGYRKGDKLGGQTDFQRHSGFVNGRAHLQSMSFWP
jgi:hypothetical protein